MASGIPSAKSVDTTHSLTALPLAEVGTISAAAYRDSFGEAMQQTLDLRTWKLGQDLGEIYTRLRDEVSQAVSLESEFQTRIREEIFPLLCSPASGVPCGGVYQARAADLEAIHRGLLFTGGVEACDGTHDAHDTLPLTIHQIGVSLVSYRGNEGTWCQRLYRRDLRQSGGDALEELGEILRRRARRSALNHASQRDILSDLARRAIMTYGERAILLDRSDAPWRMGHGNPAPWELLTMAGSMDLMIEAIKLLRRLIEGHRKFVFVASEPAERMLLTLGQALRPLEYAIVRRLDEGMNRMVEAGRYRFDSSVDRRWDGEELTPIQWMQRFQQRVASQVVVGLYRASHLAPAQVFYAHADHAHEAANIALADSVLQSHRGFPLLIDLAHHVCASVFGGGLLGGLVSTAYADAGAPWRYLSERTSRT